MSGTVKTDANDAAVSLSVQTLIDARLLMPRFGDTTARHLGSLAGQIKGPRRGQGLEFEDIRNYVSGDDIRHIDWNVTARHNQLHTRLYREEKEQTVTLVLDFTASMFTGSRKLKAVQAGVLCATLAWHIVKSNGRCGLMIQSNNEFSTLPPARGDNAALAICASIADQFKHARQHRGLPSANSLKTPPPSTPTKATAEQTVQSRLFARLVETGRHTGSLIVLSGLDRLDETLPDVLGELALSKRVACIKIEDPIEHEPLPNGRFSYRSANGLSHVTINQFQREQLKLALQQQQEKLLTLFQRAELPLLLSRKGSVATLGALFDLGFLTT